MDSSDLPRNKPPRRSELQGPRPTPLRINKNSFKIVKKPPLVPIPQRQAHDHHHRPRLPIIIYTESPKIVQVHPNDFKDVVQRLTGLPPSSNSSSSVSFSVDVSSSIADIPLHDCDQSRNVGVDIEEIEMGHGVEMMGSFQSMLSSGSGFLPPIPSNFFFPPVDHSTSLDLNPVLHGNRNFIEGSFIPSTSSNLNGLPDHSKDPNNPSIDNLYNSFKEF